MKQFRDTEYYVTEDGIIRNNKLLWKGISNKGYYYVCMYLNGKNVKFNLHRIIAETYIPNPDNLPQVNHIDGDKLNNRIKNLEWVTNQKNRDHAIQNGLHFCGEQCEKSKLTESDVKYIRDNYIPKHPEFGGIALTKKFGVGNAQISRIVNNKRWKHL